jgi:hypothetical protein
MKTDLKTPAQLLGKASWESRKKGKTKSQIKEMMSALGKRPKRISRTGRNLTTNA